MVLLGNRRITAKLRSLLALPLALLVSQATLFAQPALDSLAALAGFDPYSASAVGSQASVPIPLKARALHAYFIEVGQGDSAYIELPNGKNVLIDGGPPNPSGAGDPLVARFLERHNIAHIDYMVMTHPHSDHFAGLQYVVDNLTVDKFYDTRVTNPNSSTLKTLRTQIANDPDITVVYPKAGDTLDWAPGEVRARVLNSCPAPSSTDSGHILNDCSIVIKVTYQNTSILYTGDMESDLEAELVSRYGSYLQADVLKVGHHGSALSSSEVFLDYVRPKAAYIGVGENNYGHPSMEAMDRLRAVGASIHRTDIDGTMRYTISGG